MRETTNFAPLGVLGYCLTRTNFLAPVFDGLELKQKTVKHSPRAKLQDILVGILAGCRALSQTNTLIRPDGALAQAWGRKRFAEQGLLADTLDAFDEQAVDQLRAGNEALLRREGRVWRHNFDQEWLWLDIDLTPLPISKQAEASTKGKFAKKTVTVANWHASMLLSITRRSFRNSIRASKTVGAPTCPFSPPSNARSPFPQRSGNAPCCEPMLALVGIPMSIMR
jgi:hypothetical protein